MDEYFRNTIHRMTHLGCKTPNIIRPHVIIWCICSGGFYNLIVIHLIYVLTDWSCSHHIIDEFLIAAFDWEPVWGPGSRVANEINGGNSISSHFINITPPAGAVDTTELALNKGSSLPLSTRNPSRGQEAMLKMWKPDFQSFKYLYTPSDVLTPRNPSQ